ncbi:MAG: cob(I)yrinic acid a,c-diamide adenosyltransferase [Candidatus Bathyarchaeota archaeon]|nr:cob(I)yrinic acid a,c-diamide adenosyltransferase [Candidatus Bathyarchaeota archaeon]
MGFIYLYTGTGGGKTANALGLALRSVGHGKKVVLIQFLKWRDDIGEYLIKDRLSPNYEIYQFGREAWLGEEEKTEAFAGEKFEVERIKGLDKELARKALNFAGKIMRDKKPHLLVLDEIGLAANWKLVSIKDVLELLDNVPEETTVVMTGRLAPKELADRADFVNIVQQVKMPKDFKPTEGIQY